MDITQLILDDHHEQRRLFATLDEIDRANVEGLAAVWGRLAAFLSVHAEAEERFFYPALLRSGTGAGGRETAADETVDAIKDHNKLRHALAKAASARVGDEAWFAAVSEARVENSDQMAEEEREGLEDFRVHASLEERHTLGVAFAVFEARHIGGVRPVDKNPAAYVKDHAGSK